MMASLDLGLAWSVEVPVAKFGAHLQAYVELQPTIYTLRLCNRYGQGPKAAITKLPAELVSAIEGHLIEDERKKERKNWKTDFKCFQGLCKPIDHLSDKEQADVYFDVLGPEFIDEDLDSEDDFENFGPCCGCCHHDKLTTKQKSTLEDILDNLMGQILLEDALWWPEHENRSASWESKTGSHDGTSQGLLSSYDTTLLSNFGLQIWTAHTQTKKAKDGQFSISAVYASTVAYLIFPGAVKSISFDRAFSEARAFTSSGYLATQSGGGFITPALPVMSTALLARFTRALKTLELSRWEVRREASSKPTETAKALPDGSESKSTDAANPKAERDMTPKLRILFRNSLDHEY